jgi:hypothetical protein
MTHKNLYAFVVPFICLIAWANFSENSFAAEPVVEIEGRGTLGSGYALFVTPGEELRMRLRGAGGEVEWPLQLAPAEVGVRSVCEIESSQTIRFEYDGGRLSAALPQGAAWQAPVEPGWRTLRMSRSTGMGISAGMPQDPQLSSVGKASGVSDSVELTVCVLYSFDAQGDGLLQGYPIGIYPNAQSPNAPSIVTRYPGLYEPPKWFIRVTPETAKLKISPNFRLGEFSPPEERDQPHFIALDSRLVVFLEALRNLARGQGGAPQPVRVLQSYVSPHRKAKLKREGVGYVEYTRYQYGDAAAIIIDADDDGSIDDLNGDGQIDAADAEELADMCDTVMGNLKIYGGVGVVRSPKDTSLSAAPYVDIDLRGVKQRW